MRRPVWLEQSEGRERAGGGGENWGFYPWAGGPRTAVGRGRLGWYGTTDISTGCLPVPVFLGPQP